MKLLISLVISVSACHAQFDFSAGPRNFSHDFFKKIESNNHFVISPFGVWTLMAGVTLGATGKCKEQLQTAFRLPSDENILINGYRNLSKMVLDQSSQYVALTSKNYVFLDQGFQIYPEFKSTLSKEFNSSMVVLDFKNSTSAATIANTIIEKSGATVANVLKSDDFTHSRMILTNVISFKGLWISPFNESETLIKPFFNENRQQIGEVKMMHQRSLFNYSVLRNIKSNVLELPYGQDNKYCMLVILPHPRVSVNEVYNNFTDTTLDEIINKLDNDTEDFGLEEVEVFLPRFKINSNVVLNKPLNSMGVSDIFSAEKAKFENISREEIFISAIVHTANIEVTEFGTVASADTSAYFADRISVPYFEANRPFIFSILHRPTRTVIFSGIYSNPSVF